MMFTDANRDQWWSLIGTNVRGPFLMTRAVVPQMIVAGGGRIINLNSGAGTAERSELSAYSASKSALARLVDTPESLRERATRGMDDAARTLRLKPWGSSDSLV